MQTIRDLIAKYRKQLVGPSAIFLGLLLLIQLYFIFVVTPQPNDECIWEPDRTKDGYFAFYFREVKFEGVTWNGGIRDGDQLLEINGKKIENTFAANKILYNMATGDTAIYRVNREGRIFDAKVEVKKIVLPGNLAIFLISTIWLIVGVIVISSKPDGLSQILFFRIGVTFVLASNAILLQTQNIFNPIYNHPLLVGIIDTIQTSSVVFLPFLLVHFFWVFPNKLKILEKRFTAKILYALPLLIFLVVTPFKIFFVYDNLSAINFFAAFFGRFVSVLLGIGIFVSLISLFINYLRIKTRNERTAVFIILVAFVVGVISIGYSIILTETTDPALFYNSPELFTPIILISLLPIAFGFSIFRYSLMDVSDVVKTTILYGSATVSLAAVYFLIIYVLGQSVSSAIGTEYQGIIAGIIFIVFAVVFQSTKDRFQELITRRFYPEQFTYQKVILKFINEINTVAGIENILKATCFTFVDALMVNRFAILLKDRNSNVNYKLAVHEGLSGITNNFEVDITNLAKFILSKKDSNLLLVIEENDFENIFPNDHKNLSAENIYTIIPLFIRSRIIGFLLFGLKKSGSKFAGKDLELLTSAANQTAIAIENARLYEAEAEKLKIDRDLETAREIQMNLLPTKYPDIKSMDIAGTMIPAMHVGGDYYDLIKLSDTKFYAVIGDVSGKGLSASLYMSKLQTMVQLYCDGTLSPKEILIEINKRIYESIEKNWFITVSIALFDIEKNAITFARAGHTPMLVCNADEHKEYTPRGIGIGLESGVLFNNVIEEINIPFKKGSVITLYSDGVPELMNGNNEQFGNSKFISNIKENCENGAAEIMDNLLNEFKLHLNSSKQNDDITIILLKYDEKT